MRGKKRDKIGKIVICFLILFMCLTSIYAYSFITDNKSDFDEGVYNKTFYNISENFVQLNGTSGEYISKIFDVGLNVTWSNISFGSEVSDFFNLNLVSAVYRGINRSEVFVLDEDYYTADMKDKNKRFYLNFSDNLTNSSVLKIYAKKVKGKNVGIYTQDDIAGANPIGIFKINLTGWYNTSLNITKPTNAIWFGEGVGSGNNPKESFDYIYAEIPTRNNLTFQINSCNDLGCNGEDFIGPDGTINSYYTEKFSNLNISDNKYFRYKFYFLSRDVNYDIKLYNVTIEYFIKDIIAPNVFSLAPIYNSSFSISDIIEISVNVTDDSSISSVLANIILPNGTLQQLTLTNVFRGKYNSSFVIPSLTGKYNITFVSNDSKNNVNNSESTFFNIAIIYGMDIIKPENKTTNNFTNITYIIGIKNNGNIVDSYDLSIENLDNLEFVELNQSWINNLSVLDSVNITLKVGDSNIGNYTILFTATSRKNQNVSTKIFIDTKINLGPLIYSIGFIPSTIINGSEIRLLINASNEDSIWADITLPNSIVKTIKMKNKLKVKYTKTNLIGKYKVVFYVNDSVNNIVNISRSFSVFKRVIFNSTVKSHNLTNLNSTFVFYYNGDVISTNYSKDGIFLNQLIDTILDLKFKVYSNKLHILLKGLNISLDNNKKIFIDRHEMIDGFLVSYNINSTYNMTNSTVRIYYDDVDYTDKNGLKLHKCDDFNSIVCLGEWVDVTDRAIQNISDNYFEIVVSSFSGFGIKQDKDIVQNIGGGNGGSKRFIESLCLENCFKEVNELLSINISFIKSEIFLGENLSAKIILNKSEDSKNLNVDLYYSITDSENNIVLTERENKIVNSEIEFIKTFKLPTDINVGDYELSVVLIYGNKEYILPKSFRIIEIKELVSNQDMFIIKNFIKLVISCFLIIFLIGLWYLVISLRE